MQVGDGDEVSTAAKAPCGALGLLQRAIHRFDKGVAAVINRAPDHGVESVLEGNGPVRWHEPFGLAVIESLYFGCPVFATPYGALPELVPESTGVLSNSRSALADAVRSRHFDPRACHQLAVEQFSAIRMAKDYLLKYQRVLDGELLHASPPAMQGSAKDLDWLP